MRIIYITFLFIIEIFCLYTNVYGQESTRDSIQFLLEKAYLRDQRPRQTIDSLIRSNIIDGNKYFQAIEDQQQADSINLIIVPPLIDKISESQLYDLDSMAYKACWIFIQHAPDSIMHKYKKFINQLLEKKLISINSYMAYIDRGKVRQSKAQIYGWQFKRFSNGLTIQFPILAGFESEWRKLGLEYNTDKLIPDEYKVQYNYQTCINNRQFAILGITSHNDNNISQFKDELLLSIDNEIVAKSDSLGFFKIIIRKQDLPIKLQISTQNVSTEYVVKKIDEIDYIFLNCLINEKTGIEVIDE